MTDKGKVYAVTDDGSEDFIGEAPVCEEIPSGIDSLMNTTMEDLIKTEE